MALVPLTIELLAILKVEVSAIETAFVRRGRAAGFVGGGQGVVEAAVGGRGEVSERDPLGAQLYGGWLAGALGQ